MKRTWLVYYLEPCEQGSEGVSGWGYYAIAQGDTDDEIYTDWVKNVRLLYGADLSEDLKCNNGYWSCYYRQLCKVELPKMVYGRSEPIEIYRVHEDHETNEHIKKKM